MKRLFTLSNEKKYFSIVIIFSAAALSISGFLLFSHVTYSLGFPLDDAWIHQSFARNLALSAEWALIPGQATSGSTSPLWTLLLTASYLLKLPPLYWTFFLGWLILGGQAYVGEQLFRSLTLRSDRPIPWVGLFLIGEWHLVWAAASGMETLLFGFFIVIIFYLLSNPTPKYFTIGLLCGLSVWVRPDGITLLGPVLLIMILNGFSVGKISKKFSLLFIGFLICFIPYLAFNLFLSGSFWPNTFYAKQAEYFSLIQKPLIDRLLSLISLPLVGAGLLLIPGLAFLPWRNNRKTSFFLVAALMWWVGFNLVYALRLPLAYQHGRYLIPAMPILFIILGAGCVKFFSPSMRFHRIRNILNLTWRISLIIIWGAFYCLGAKSYGQDVAIIGSEMVASAKWISANSKPGDIIAAHDIGALGYFGNRKIIDMAGLISPDVIPFIRDETQLALYLDEKKVDFLILFPSWYPNLTRSAEAVYDTQGLFSPSFGGENMKIYRWGK